MSPGSNRAFTANGGSPSELLPPRELQDWVGGGGPAVYTATGTEFLGYLVDLCGLRPGDAVLDVGCGSGRMALPLAGYLNHEGRYAGFDVSREAVAWCTENISGAHPNFDFTVVDVENGVYNPTGIYKSSDFRFPYPDGSFDVVLLASLFTHMLPSDMQHYLHEIVRVLKPGGRSLITFFLLNEESLALITEGKASFNFEHEMAGYRMTHAEIPEAAIAYPEDFVRYLHAECGLELRDPLHYGTWCGRTNAMSGQDVVIADKAASGRRLAASGGSENMPQMSRAAAEQYITSLYGTFLQRDPGPEEFAHWVTTATQQPPEQVYFAFVNSNEYKLKQRKSVPTMFGPGHYHSPIVDPSTIAEYVQKEYLQAPGDIKGIHFDDDAMVRFWEENAEFIKNTPFSEHDDGTNRYYSDNGAYPYGDATMLRAMIAHFKPRNIIEVGSGFSSACILDAVDHVGLSDFTMTCIDPDAGRLRSRLREEDHSRVDIIEGLVQDVPVSAFSELKENDILFIDSSHVLKTASDVHYELFSILPSLNKGVLIHFHDIQYPFEYPRKWLFEGNYSWNEIYGLRAFLMYNSAFEVVFWTGLFTHRHRQLVHETNPLFLENPGASIWLRARTEGRLQTPPGTEDLSNFDAVWYARSYPLAAEESSPTDAALLEQHYHRTGRYRGYKPNPKAVRPRNAAAMPSPYGGLWIDQANALDLIRGKYELGNITADEARDLETFVLDGYVVLKNAVPGEILDRATEVLEAAYEGRYPQVRFECPSLGRSSDGRHRAWQARMREVPAKALDLHWHFDEIRDLGFAPAVARFLHLLFERPASASQSLGFYRGSEQPMHQDSAYVAYSLPQQFSAAWFALEDVKPDAGELMYFVESHRKLPEFIYADGFKSMVDAQLAGFSGDLLMEEDVKHGNAIESEGQRLLLKRESFMAKRGDVLLWHSELAHGGRPISTSASRKSVVFHYSPREIVPLYTENRSVQYKRHSLGCYYSSGVYSHE